MAMRHEKLPKDQAPRRGGYYTVYHEGTPLYDAEIVKYGGGCWATVKVVRPVDERTAAMYTPGDAFDIRVAMYEFRHMPWEGGGEQNGEHSSDGGGAGG